MNTPAVTMVAAWMSAETGVGPSIASGSQVCSRNCADLPIAPMNSSRQVERHRVDSRAPKTWMLLPAMPGAAAKIASKRDRAGEHEDEEDAEREAEIADAVDDERLDRRGVGRGLLIPEADQQIGGEAHAFPAEEHLHEIVGRHQHQHGEGEQRQIGEEARPDAGPRACSRWNRDARAPRRVVTTTSITAVSVSTRSAQSTLEIARGEPVGEHRRARMAVAERRRR